MTLSLLALALNALKFLLLLTPPLGLAGSRLISRLGFRCLVVSRLSALEVACLLQLPGTVHGIGVRAFVFTLSNP